MHGAARRKRRRKRRRAPWKRNRWSLADATNSVYAVGDLHGCYSESVELLRTHGLINGSLAWCAGPSTLCFVGDYVDHGPDGIACIDLVMRLETEAAAAGGRVLALLGNHEVLLLAAHRLGGRRNPLQAGTFVEQWRDKEGADADLAGLAAHHVAWLTRLPAVALVDGHLLLHADAPFYREHGHSVADVNRSIAALLTSDDGAAWAHFIEQFGEHHAFRQDPALARSFLQTYGGHRIIHGHTPLCKVLDEPMPDITEPLLYADGLCVNVDHGLYLDGPGFVYAV